VRSPPWKTSAAPGATWTVGAGPAHIVLDVRAAGVGVTVLHSMFASLRPPRPA